MTHKRPDGDTIGCAAGLCRALRKLGKTAYVLPNEDATSLLAGYLGNPLLHQRRRRPVGVGGGVGVDKAAAVGGDGHIQRHGDLPVAVAPISLDMMAQAGATSEDTDDLAAFLGQIEGTLHTATIREHEGGECRVSVRTFRVTSAGRCSRISPVMSWVLVTTPSFNPATYSLSEPAANHPRPGDSGPGPCPGDGLPDSRGLLQGHLCAHPLP